MNTAESRLPGDIRLIRARVVRITLPDDVHVQLKAHAARSGRSMSWIMTEAARVWLLRRQAAREAGPVRLPTCSEGGGVLPGVNLDSNAALCDYFDEIGEKCWP
jgi:plasmid stability protein